MNNLIQYWDSIISTNCSPEIVESAFLRIYIEFENYLRTTFVTFSLGNSYSTYVPQRKLHFSDSTQLAEVIRGEGNFVDYIKAIPRCAKHIFQNNPFDLIYASVTFSDDLKKMLIIRNYLAHRSDESKQKYLNNVLKTFGIQSFEEPGVFLLRQMNRTSQTYYSYFCSLICDIQALFKNDTVLSSI